MPGVTRPSSSSSLELPYLKRKVGNLWMSARHEPSVGYFIAHRSSSTVGLVSCSQCLADCRIILRLSLNRGHVKGISKLDKLNGNEILLCSDSGSRWRCRYFNSGSNCRRVNLPTHFRGFGKYSVAGWFALLVIAAFECGLWCVMMMFQTPAQFKLKGLLPYFSTSSLFINSN